MLRLVHCSAFVLLLSLVIGAASSDPAPALSYSIGVLPGDSAALTVELRIDERHAGPIRLQLPSEWAGQSGLERAVSGLRAATPGDQIVETDTAWVKILNHVAGAVAVVRYELRQDWAGPIQSPNYHRAIVQPDWALLVGQNALVLPEDKADEPRSVTLDFTYLPPDWIVGTSYGIGHGPQVVSASVTELWDLAIALGHWRSRDVRVGGKPIHVLQHGQQAFTDAAFDSILAVVVGTERKFWRAHAPANYLVTLMPTRPGEFGGTRLNGAFMVAVDSTARVDQRIVRLLAHELFHEWNGGGNVLHAAPGPEERLKWFTEGFTDFYAWELAHRSRAISDSIYAAGITDLLHQRGMSTWRDSSSAALEHYFWLNDEAKLEAYHRGNVFALRADRALRDASKGKKSMDDVMHRLAADSLHAALTDELITGALQAEGLPDAGRWIAEMREGRPIPLTPASLGKCFTGEVYSSPRFDLGFDFPQSRAAKSLRGVDTRSAGYAAGLRDSMPVLGFSFYNSDPTRTATITVAAPDGSRSPISYLPATADSVTLVRFTARPRC
jgi:predicted metalloprotease with PDZ domain